MSFCDSLISVSVSVSVSVPVFFILFLAWLGLGFYSWWCKLMRARQAFFFFF